jgi:hypothetical protein
MGVLFKVLVSSIQTLTSIFGKIGFYWADVDMLIVEQDFWQLLLLLGACCWILPSISWEMEE